MPGRREVSPEVIEQAEDLLRMLQATGFSVARASGVLACALGKILYATGSGKEPIEARVTTDHGVFTVRVALTEATYVTGKQ